jgi:hypothetical protein
VELENITDRIVKHVEARVLFYLIGWPIHIHKIEYRRQNLVHALDILDLWIQP